MNEFFIYGPRRSGLHAIAGWIMCHAHPSNLDFEWFESRKIYINDMVRDPYPLELFNSKCEGNMQVFGHECWEVTADSVFHPTANQDATKKAVIILRDPFNWVASMIAYPPPDFRRRLDLLIPNWIRYAENFYLSESKPEIMAVKYNNWFADIEYRKSISAWMGYSFSDAGINMVSKFGEGSSFDKRKYDGQAQNMKVLDRWRVKEKEVRAVIGQKPKLREYSKQIFNFDPF